jgi:uncharacterized YccA/Bax inhibitor family protein
MSTPDEDHSARARWTPERTRTERAAQLARDELNASRDAHVAFILTLLGCVMWVVVGLALVAWALHTTDPELGGIAFMGGILVGYVGIVVTLARYYLRGEADGWW